MAAELGTSANLMSGIRELDFSTSTYAGHFESDGGAYDLLLPFQADKLEIWNYTKFGTNSQTLHSVWFRDMPDGDALLVTRGTTDLSSTLEATNGITVNNTDAGFADEHVTITGITTATPGVVTAAAHGLSNGDRLYITKLSGNIGLELNNKQYVAQNVTTNTFELYDIYGNAVTVAATYSASGGQVNKMVASAGIVNSPEVYKLTIGTASIGNDSDEMYFVATKFNSYYDLGDIA